MTVQAKTTLARVLDSSQVKKRKLVPQIEDKLLFSELAVCEVEDVDGTP